jgi:hypothetical protein
MSQGRTCTKLKIVKEITKENAIKFAETPQKANFRTQSTIFCYKTQKFTYTNSVAFDKLRVASRGNLTPSARGVPFVSLLHLGLG